MSMENDPRPVDSLVRDIRFVVEDFEDICTVYRGQEKHCCDAVLTSCYGNIDQTLDHIRLQGALSQNMHQACRRIDEELQTVNSCVETQVNLCYKIDPRYVEADFQEFKRILEVELDKHCNSLPPERTTSKTASSATQTTRSQTTLTFLLPTTTEVVTKEVTNHQTVSTTKTTRKLTDTDIPTATVLTTVHTNINVTDTDIVTSTTDRSTVSRALETSRAITLRPTNTEQKFSPNQTTDIPAISTSFRSTTDWLPGRNEANLDQPQPDNTVIIVPTVCSGILVLLAVLIFLVIRMRKKGTMPDCVSDPCSKGFPCKCHLREKCQTGPQEEIYAEIDEAFMQAVYEFDKRKDPHPKLKNRIQTNAHINVCYSSADDGVITSPKSCGPTLQLSTKNLRQVPKQNTYQTTNQLKGSSENIQKGFVFSHPTFTDPRGTEILSDEYVQISEKYESIQTNYDCPTHQNRSIPNTSDRSDVASANEYDHIVTKDAEHGMYSEPDYVNSGVTKTGEHLYENEIGTYEITQSRF